MTVWHNDGETSHKIPVVDALAFQPQAKTPAYSPKSISIAKVSLPSSKEVLDLVKKHKFGVMLGILLVMQIGLIKSNAMQASQSELELLVEDNRRLEADVRKLTEATLELTKIVNKKQRVSLAPQPTRVVEAAFKANLRIGPGEDYRVLMTVAPGLKLTYEGKEGAWFKVKTPSREIGWIREDLVQ